MEQSFGENYKSATERRHPDGRLASARFLQRASIGVPERAGVARLGWE